MLFRAPAPSILRAHVILVLGDSDIFSIHDSVGYTIHDYEYYHDTSRYQGNGELHICMIYIVQMTCMLL